MKVFYTLKRRILTNVEFCCSNMANSCLTDRFHRIIISDGKVCIDGSPTEMIYCPFCGRKIIFESIKEE